MKDYGTLSEAINELKSEGYTHDFNLIDEYLELKAEKEHYTASEFKVDKVLRFEGMSNPDDNAILYAISTSDQRKGVLTDAYGAYGNNISKALLDKLNMSSERP